MLSQRGDEYKKVKTYPIILQKYSKRRIKGRKRQRRAYLQVYNMGIWKNLKSNLEYDSEHRKTKARVRLLSI